MVGSPIGGAVVDQPTGPHVLESTVAGIHGDSEGPRFDQLVLDLFGGEVGVVQDSGGADCQFYAIAVRTDGLASCGIVAGLGRLIGIGGLEWDACPVVEL